MPWHENITALTFFINQPFQLGSLSRNLAGLENECFVRGNSQHWIFLYLRCLLSPEAYYGQNYTAVHTKHINETISGHWWWCAHCQITQLPSSVTSSHNLAAKHFSAQNPRTACLSLGPGREARLGWLVSDLCVKFQMWQWGWWRVVLGVHAHTLLLPSGPVGIPSRNWTNTESMAVSPLTGRPLSVCNSQTLQELKLTRNHAPPLSYNPQSTQQGPSI